MKKGTYIISLILAFALPVSAKDDFKVIRKAIKRSTLAQPGTPPFHLKATFSPSYARDNASGRNGQIEIWWVSPTKWRREVQCPQFHQTEIVDRANDWQKNDGDYFPEWLRELAQAIIEPVPSVDEVLNEAKGGEDRHIFGGTQVSWQIFSTDGTVKKSEGAGITLQDSTGLLSFAGGSAFDGGYDNYQKFHNRMISRVVTSGSPEVKAQIVTLEDLGQVPPDFFSTQGAGGDIQPLRTALVAEPDLRKNLLTSDPISWPSLKDGPLDGLITTDVVVDRNGTVREIGSILSDNPGLSQDAGRAIMAFRFKPYLQNGIPVQVVSRITMPFHTVRPSSVENFQSAQAYFEKGRTVGFPAAGSGAPYIIRAEFQANVSDDTVQKGEYTDTWMKSDEWRREATIGKSRYIRSQHGTKQYLLTEGPDSKLLALVLHVIEPIPAIDTFVESDWRMKREDVSGVSTVRVLAGYESAQGELDPQQARAYWFDSDGRLLKTFFGGIETDRRDFKQFEGTQVPQQVLVFQGGQLALPIQITEMTNSVTPTSDEFDLKGHGWTRQFTDQVR